MHDHEVELALGLMGAHEFAQFAGVSAGLEALMRHLEPPHEPLHLFEMLELLARQPRERDVERAVLGVGEDQCQRGGGRLLLAVGVIDQQRGQIARGSLGPRARRRRAQDGLPRGALEALRRGLTVCFHGGVSGAPSASSANSMSLAAESASAGRSFGSLAMSVSMSGWSDAMRSGSFGMGALA